MRRGQPRPETPLPTTPSTPPSGNPYRPIAPDYQPPQSQVQYKTLPLRTRPRYQQPSGTKSTRWNTLASARRCQKEGAVSFGGAWTLGSSHYSRHFIISPSNQANDNNQPSRPTSSFTYSLLQLSFQRRLRLPPVSWAYFRSQLSDYTSTASLVFRRHLQPRIRPLHILPDQENPPSRPNRVAVLASGLRQQMQFHYSGFVISQ